MQPSIFKKPFGNQPAPLWHFPLIVWSVWSTQEKVIIN